MRRTSVTLRWNAVTLVHNAVTFDLNGLTPDGRDVTLRPRLYCTSPESALVRPVSVFCFVLVGVFRVTPFVGRRSVEVWLGMLGVVGHAPRPCFGLPWTKVLDL